MDRRAAAVGVGLLLVVLRAPSLIEPPQFGDEGTYADIGFALDHGAVLYQSVWDNKPPGIYWLAALINHVHASVVAYHVLTTALVVLTSIGIYMVGRRLGLGPGSWAATASFVVLASLPPFGGDILNAEVLGATLVTGAVILVPDGNRVAWLRHAGAGARVAGALPSQATFLAAA